MVGLFPEQYTISDTRLNKPVCHQEIVDGEITGSMLVQDLDSAPIDRNRKITYFCPNNVAVLLSASSKALANAKKLHADFFNDPSIEFSPEKNSGDKKIFLNGVSSKVCDYIEHVQTSIVFAYTALETFVNLSIPSDYQYEKENGKGVKEVYDKAAIERWLSLKVKFQYILKDVYKSESLECQKWWGHFSNLEALRNNIIHQKTINSTNFFKEYFKESTFAACECPLPIIRFFYEAHADQNRTNPIWPWLVNEKNYFPLNPKYNPQKFEVEKGSA